MAFGLARPDRSKEGQLVRDVVPRLVLRPFLGLACAVLYRWDNRELRRDCPRCGKVVKLYDAVCVRCGEELEFPNVAIAPEAAIR